MENSLLNLPKELINFVLVLLFSLSIGMEQLKKNSANADRKTYGTDRTFTFIGLFGYILLMASPDDALPYLIGFILLAVLLMIFYFVKAWREGNYGMTTVLLGLIVYTFPLLIERSSLWLSLLLFVVVMILAELKEPLREFNKRIAENEFLTIAKFIIIAGIVLPILPDSVISSYLPVSPYKIWLAVVVVSAISYLSYLLRRYVFPNAGLLLTGLLGGLYSSTATTVILSRKSKENSNDPQKYAGSIILATAMMFPRIYVLFFIFNKAEALRAWPYFLILFAVSLYVGYAIYRKGQRLDKGTEAPIDMGDKNPLEFRIALLFALLFVVFSSLTQYVVINFGSGGLMTLSFISGFTDIDPFLLNLFQGHQSVPVEAILPAAMMAILSNNVLKAGYANFLGNKKMSGWVWKGMGIILSINAILMIILGIRI
jgi:uncharacterized membrane protein (DUF4010 family)